MIAGDVPLTDVGVGREAMESISAGAGERAKNGGDADKARSAAAAAATYAADAAAVAVLAACLSA